MGRPMNDYDWEYYRQNKDTDRYKTTARRAKQKWYRKKKQDPVWMEQRRAKKRAYWATRGKSSQAANRAKRRQELLDRKLHLQRFLGGVCKQCGIEDHRLLDFDHIDPATKAFAISNNFYKPLGDLMAEVEKCQLLCANCHRLKTLAGKEQTHPLLPS